MVEVHYKKFNKLINFMSRRGWKFRRFKDIYEEVIEKKILIVCNSKFVFNKFIMGLFHFMKK